MKNSGNFAGEARRMALDPYRFAAGQVLAVGFPVGNLEQVWRDGSSVVPLRTLPMSCPEGRTLGV